MKKTLWALLAVPTLLGASTFLCNAAPQNPAYHLTTVSWVVATKDDINKDDHYVTLIGHVTKREGDETYFFTDGTGTVRLTVKSLSFRWDRELSSAGGSTRPTWALAIWKSTCATGITRSAYFEI